jgi:biopolymer transport protein ExbB/TolQ
MSLSPSQRPTREGPLLALALALVCAICLPLYQWTPAEAGGNANLQRIRQMLLGPEQIVCYCFFTWGCFILLSRYLEVVRQHKAFGLSLLPTEEGARILPEDARPLSRKVEQLTRGRPYILANMIRLSLGKYGITRSGADVSDAVRTQADVEMGRLVSGMALVHYLAWAIPALGFLGTVRGLGMSLGVMNQTGGLEEAVRHLYFAFDTTLVALVVSLPLMFFLHTVQREEEGLVIDCQQYCLEHLVARLYNVETEHAHA